MKSRRSMLDLSLVFLLLMLFCSSQSFSRDEETDLLLSIRSIYKYPRDVFYVVPYAFEKRCFPATSSIIPVLESRLGYRIEDAGEWYVIIRSAPRVYYDEVLKFHDEFFSFEDEAFVRALRNRSASGDDMSDIVGDLVKKTAIIEVGSIVIHIDGISQDREMQRVAVRTNFVPSAPDLDKLTHALVPFHADAFKERSFELEFVRSEGGGYSFIQQAMDERGALVLQEENKCK